MAGDWIKLETVTPDKPEVHQMAEHLGIDPDAVVGKLIRIWIWADQQTTDGNAAGVTRSLLDRLASVTGFSDALVRCGWLEETEDGLVFVNFQQHNGQTAKKRAVTARRVAQNRQKKRSGNAGCNAGGVTHGEQGRYLEGEVQSTEYPPTTTVTGDLDYLQDPGTPFRMHDKWQPTAPEKIRDLLQASGVPRERLDTAAVIEFRNFWQTRANKETQAAWEHKLFGRLLNQHKRGTHGNGAEAGKRGDGAAGHQQSVHEAIDNIDDKSWANP